MRRSGRPEPGTERTGEDQPATCDPSRRRERRRAAPDRTQDRRRALERQREPLPTRVEDTPPLPTEYGRALGSALVALGLHLDDRALGALEGHVRLLLAWNRAINLTAIRDPAEVAVAHIADSLTAVAPLRARGIDRILDLGSGAGFPGLPLAIGLPAQSALLVDSVAKKVRFLETVVRATGLADTVAAASARAESLGRDPRHRERWPAVTARAVAPLAELSELAFPLLMPGGVLVAWKRGDLAAELAAAERAVAGLGGGGIDAVAAPDAILPGHRLVIVTKHGRTPEAYPRDPAPRRRAPW